MCAINPLFSCKITFNIYTAHGNLQEFLKTIEEAIPVLLATENVLNTGKLRWHLQEPTDIKAGGQLSAGT